MRFSVHTASAVNEFRGSNAALAPAAYASRIVLPPPLQGSLPAGWLAFTGRELNPLDRYKRFQITSLVPLFWICPGARKVSWRPQAVSRGQSIMPLHLPQCLLSPADRCGGAEA